MQANPGKLIVLVILVTQELNVIGTSLLVIESSEKCDALSSDAESC